MEIEEKQMIVLPISAESLSRYLNGTAGEVERANIEQLLKDDEMLKESIDGLRMVSNPEMIIQLTNELNANITLKTGFIVPKAKVFHISSAVIKPMMAIAASLIVVAGSFLLLKNLGNKQDKIAAVEKNNDKEKDQATSFEQNILYSDSELTQAVTTKKMESNEEAILNDGYINQLDSVNATSSGSVINLPLTNKATTVSTSSNMLNPMKTLTSGGTYAALTEKYQDRLEDETIYNGTKSPLTIKGQVIDNRTNQPIVGAAIIIDGKREGTSNINGFYEVAVEGAKHDMVVKQNGYDEEKQQVVLSGDKISVNVELNQNDLESGLIAKYENQQAKDKDKSAVNASVIEEKNSISDKSDNSLKEGLQNYSAQNYSLAITNLNKTLVKDPNNNEALFYVAMSHYNMGNNNKALSFYSKTIASGGKYEEDALWYKAQILLKQKDKAEAKKILEELKSTKYSQRSTKLLETIDK